MEKKFILTGVGSPTFFISVLEEIYHSLHAQESVHVFINAVLKFLSEKNHSPEISILEVGFGTGLNALLTSIKSQKEAGFKSNHLPDLPEKER